MLVKMIPVTALIIGIYIFINFIITMIITLYDKQNSIDEGGKYYLALLFIGFPLLIVSFFMSRGVENEPSG